MSARTSGSGKRRRLPRVVIVSRPTPYQLLLDRHGTRSQARFYLAAREQEIDDFEAEHESFLDALTQVDQAIPPDQRRTRIERGHLDRFLFAPDDVVVIVGQDGLVPNTAKYLAGQLTIGINPDPGRYDGVLCPHPPAAADELLDWVGRRDGRFRVQSRTMVSARREDGQQLLALNEVFVGHQTHQSARYRIAVAGREERQSSSGVICTTGTGATGWARSIARQRQLSGGLPRPQQPRLAWFVREPFPSVVTGTELDFGVLDRGTKLWLYSEMSAGGVVFADGIESDRLEFLTSHRLEIGLAAEALKLVMPPGKRKQKAKERKKRTAASESTMRPSILHRSRP